MDQPRSSYDFHAPVTAAAIGTGAVVVNRDRDGLPAPSDDREHTHALEPDTNEGYRGRHARPDDDKAPQP